MNKFIVHVALQKKKNSVSMSMLQLKPSSTQTLIALMKSIFQASPSTDFIKPCKQNKTKREKCRKSRLPDEINLNGFFLS